MKKSATLTIVLFILVSIFWAFVPKDAPTFTSASHASFSSWLLMRLDKGAYPAVNPAEAKAIVTQADMALIHSPATVPRATWIGHATMLVQYKGIHFLTDPHLTERPAPMDFLVPKRFTPPAISFDTMPKIDFIVISHNHYDHLDHRTVDRFGSSVTWYVPFGLKDWFLARGIETNKVVELNWWESHAFNAQVTVTFTPSVHWSKRTPWDTNDSHWGAWSVDVHGFNTWFGGDTAYDEPLFKEIGQRTGPYDMAFIPIGAYGPRSFMLKQHVDPAQAVRVHEDIRSKKSIPIHWGTFQLTHEPFLEPPKLLKAAMVKKGLPLQQFSPIKVGETVEGALLH